MSRIDGSELADHTDLLGSASPAESDRGTPAGAKGTGKGMADREGFEPSVRLLTYDGLANMQ